MRWQVQEAKQRFSEVLRRAQDDGPQIVTKHGEDLAVVLNIKDYRKLQPQDSGDFLDFLMTMPELPEEAFERRVDPPRSLDLED